MIYGIHSCKITAERYPTRLCVHVDCTVCVCDTCCICLQMPMSLEVSLSFLTPNLIKFSPCMLSRVFVFVCVWLCVCVCTVFVTCHLVSENTCRMHNIHTISINCRFVCNQNGSGARSRSPCAPNAQQLPDIALNI